MDVYLVRSSLAVDDPTVPEAHRHLSLEGRRLVRELGNRLRLTEEPSFAAVLTSPAAAALQTAELFADRTDFLGVVEVLPLLVPATPPSVIAPLVLARGAAVAVVADEPVLAALGAFLVGRPTFPPAVHGQVSLVQDRRAAWCLRPGEHGRSLLLIA